MNPDALLTVTQAAKLIGESKQLVNWWRTSGRLPAERHNGRWLYRLGNVLATERATRRSPHSSRTAAA